MHTRPPPSPSFLLVTVANLADRTNVSPCSQIIFRLSAHTRTHADTVDPESEKLGEEISVFDEKTGGIHTVQPVLD